MSHQKLHWALNGLRALREKRKISANKRTCIIPHAQMHDVGRSAVNPAVLARTQLDQHMYFWQGRIGE